MSQSNVNKSFVSDIDKFLQEYHVLQPKTQSEMQEVYKSQRIAIRRDDPNAVSEQDLFNELSE